MFAFTAFAWLLVPERAAGGDTPKKRDQEDKFRQLEEILPTPNACRTASGAPGHAYWQQQVDYRISVEIDDEKQRLTGTETIRYFNRSPDTLRYLWLQLEGNIFAPDSDAKLTTIAPNLEQAYFGTVRRLLASESFDGSVKITSVRDEAGAPLPHTIVKTMMRVDLPTPLRSGESFRFSVDWHYAINDFRIARSRTGAEFFKKDGNWIYELAHWFPRLAAYTDVNGWQHKQFLGRGEFTLELGNYLVRITTPDDHVVAATGVLQNPDEVLRPLWRERLAQAARAEKPMFVITPEEAKANEQSKPSGKKTWIFHAENVRDFAFACSRKFIWDAQGHEVDGHRVMAMSFYPNEGEPLWSRYSTHAIIHTLNVYSRYTFTYPYPVAISVNGPVGGMEYPMICFNGPRPDADGTYSKRTKYGLISVVIHEVGHNYFPMIVNSDERQWTWMDEGLNTFIQYLAEQEWEENYPSRRGEPQDIAGYMKSTDQVPIMTSSESILQFHNNAYAKPATALNILRESILGRELFDFAFKEYARRWKFKRPQPADLFRTLEDASGVDLDWFWRGWFYSTDHTDIAIANLQRWELDIGDPAIDKPRQREERDALPKTLSQQRNKSLPKRVDAFPELKDFYNDYDPLEVTDEDRRAFENFVAGLKPEDRKVLDAHRHVSVVELENIGGLVMPVVLRVDYEDGTHEEVRIPAEIWRRDSEKVSKLLLTEKPVASVTLDPHLETADVDLENNRFPRRPVPSRFKLFKSRRGGSNPMRDAKRRQQRQASGDKDGRGDAKAPAAKKRTF